MQKFFELEINSETEDMLNDICDGIYNLNRTLIKKILSMTFDFNQLSFSYEEDIKYLYKLSKPKKEIEESLEFPIQMQARTNL